MAVPMGFQLQSKRTSTDFLCQDAIAVPSTQYYADDALYMKTASDAAGGELIQVAATSYATHILVSMSVPKSLLRPATALLSTTQGEKIKAIPCAGNGSIWRTQLAGVAAPLKNLIACAANSTVNQIAFLDTGSTGDLLGGQIWVDTLNKQFTITADVLNSGTRTVTIIGDLPTSAITTGSSIMAVPWSQGFQGVKFNATNPSRGIDTSVAGSTGGHVNIEGVVLGTAPGLPYALVTFPDE